MKDHKLLEITPWFDTEVDGPPLRVGVYEGSAIGHPEGGGGIYQHGYYYWDGEKWTGWGRSPDHIRPSSIFHARYWRGVIPGKGYPYDQVKTWRPSHFTGTLAPVGTAMGQINVHRLEVSGENRLNIQLTWELSARDPESYQCLLIRQGTEFIGKAKARIRSFTATADTHFRAVLAAEDHGNDTDDFPLTLSLQSHTKPWYVFQGVVRKPSAPR